jgi:hypothetical protein
MIGFIADRCFVDLEFFGVPAAGGPRALRARPCPVPVRVRSFGLALPYGGVWGRCIGAALRQSLLKRWRFFDTMVTRFAGAVDQHRADGGAQQGAPTLARRCGKGQAHSAASRPASTIDAFRSAIAAVKFAEITTHSAAVVFGRQ